MKRGYIVSIILSLLIVPSIYTKSKPRITLQKQVSDLEEQLKLKDQELADALTQIQQLQEQKINSEIQKINSLDAHIQRTDAYLTTLHDGFNNSLSYNKIPYAAKIAGYTLKSWGLKCAKFLGIGALEWSKKPAVTISTSFNNKIMTIRSQRDKLQTQLNAKQQELFATE